jgi:alanyl-tRNA synthetase
MRVTEDARPVLGGEFLFKLKSSYGFPLEMAIDMAMNRENMAIDWVGLIEAARKNDWWDFQTYDVICHALEDAGVDADTQEGIKSRFKRYVTVNKHPNL